MQKQHILFASLLVLLILLAAGCSATNAAPAPNGAAVPNQSTPANAPSNTAGTANSRSGSSSSFEPKTVEGGSVTVTVTPLSLKAGAPLEFEIAMNTHSVDLSDDMLKAVVLRDDAGKEYAPTAWDGPASGGHHRSGKVTLPDLASGAKSVTLVVKGIAGVPERSFKWDLPE